MKKVLVMLLIAAAFMEGCKRDEDNVSPSTPPVTTKAESIILSSLDKDAVEFYKDAAVLAEWYSEHPAMLDAEVAKNKMYAYTDSNYNDFIAEFSAIDIVDSNNKHMSFFSLDDSARHIFLRDYVKLEAKFLNEKLVLANNEAADDYAENRNTVFDKIANTSSFSETMSFKAEAAKITSSKPYSDLTEELEHSISPNLGAATNSDGAGVNEQQYYKYLAAFSIFPVFPVTYNPLCFNSTPQAFVDNLRSQLKKGRVLVALPAGYQTGNVLVLNGTTFDVGHVAIISKDASEIPATIPNDFSFTIGTNPENGMHVENLANDWTSKHGMSYLMQPVRKSYQTLYQNIAFGVKVPYGFSTTVTDVNNIEVYNKIKTVLGKPYCGYYEIVYAKFKSPTSFICSSAAWWAIKEAYDINIGDFYKPSIFPAGVYLSGDMRIVAKSF